MGKTKSQVKRIQRNEQRVGRKPAYPVDLLRDDKGIYGIGKIADDPSGSRTLILRPDRFVDAGASTSAALQMLPGGGPHCFFNRSIEAHFEKEIYCGMLERAGFMGKDRPRRPDGSLGAWWTKDPEQENVNRKKYFGLPKAARTVLNRLISRALSEAADPIALLQARRFAQRERYRIYQAAAKDHRFAELASAFPVLVLRICNAEGEAKLEAQRLVKEGATVEKIAEFMRVPLALQKIKPGAAHLAIGVASILAANPGLINSDLPELLPRMRAWLRNCASSTFRTESGCVVIPFKDRLSRANDAESKDAANVECDVDLPALFGLFEVEVPEEEEDW